MRARRRLPLLAAIAAAALSAGATAAVSIAQNDDGRSTDTAVSRASGATGFAVLHRAQSAEDKLPAGVLSRFGPDNLTGPRVDQGTARKVGRLAESDLYIAEGPGSFCTIRVGGAGWSGGCTAKSRAVSGEPLVTFDMVESPDGNDYRVWGVAPEGVARAAVVLEDGTRVSAPLHGGAFEVTTDDPGAAFAWTDAQGIEHSQQVLRPPVQ